MTQDKDYSNHWIADDGMVLMNQYGAFGKEIWLGVGDSIENWHEVSEEEANA